MNFSHEQLKAISHTFGPALVLAGPGSGKTRVIVQRLVNLLKNYPSSQILSLTFSNAASTEMQQRFFALCANNYPSVHFATIHSLSYSILRKYWPSQTKPVLINTQLVSVMKKIFYQVNHFCMSDAEVEMLISAISRSRNNIHFNSQTVQIKNFTKLCYAYEQYKKKNNFIDYDDMIFYAREILANTIQLDNSYKYDFVQVDEAQDLTVAQFDIIRKIANRNNIFVVADDDQSIYGFRGAEPACLADFQERATDCVKYYLNDNYRCAPEIVNFSGKIIAKNRNRFAKTPVSKNRNIGKIEILHLKNSLCQAKFVFLTVAECKKSKTFGILYRNNSSALSIAAMLINRNIAFYISGGSCALSWDYVNFFIMEYIRNHRMGEKPQTTFTRIINNGFRNKCIVKRKIYQQDIEAINTAIDCLYTVCCLCTNLDQVRHLIQEVWNVCHTGQNQGDILPNKKIYLTTIHSSKGLEYDSVFVLDMMRDEFPGRSSASGKLLEEERRLFYVAVTRAKLNLYLLYPENYGLISREEGLFICEGRTALKGV